MDNPPAVGDVVQIPQGWHVVPAVVREVYSSARGTRVVVAVPVLGPDGEWLDKDDEMATMSLPLAELREAERMAVTTISAEQYDELMADDEDDELPPEVAARWDRVAEKRRELRATLRDLPEQETDEGAPEAVMRESTALDHARRAANAELLGKDEFAEFDTDEADFDAMMARGEPVELVDPPTARD